MASAEEVAAMRLLFEQQQARFEEQHQAFVADQQTRAAQTQQLLENNNNLAARIDELLRLGQSEQDKRQELERERDGRAGLEFQLSQAFEAKARAKEQSVELVRPTPLLSPVPVALPVHIL